MFIDSCCSHAKDFLLKSSKSVFNKKCKMLLELYLVVSVFKKIGCLATTTEDTVQVKNFCGSFEKNRQINFILNFRSTLDEILTLHFAVIIKRERNLVPSN